MWFQYKKGRGQSNYPFLLRMLITGEREIPPFLRSGSREFEPLAVPVLGLVSNSRPQFVMFVFVCCCFSAVHYQNQSIIFRGDSRRGGNTRMLVKNGTREGITSGFHHSARELRNINCSSKTRKEKTYVDRLLNTRRGNQTKNCWINQ